ncbi:hypothetical protein IQ268_02215 [Oculatella sp. LEGE 06141]|uniref:hypothetical protein n=1 Tax=Oculatella sp. LEGE 06141 TaxID=1828648 RepID=UPI00187E8994|nr:hypothetical protein [Oculatella sp. LEGE 06141]MBE9177389.1 hypothetical protein [Oculatella sp. LEGE 06141]
MYFESGGAEAHSVAQFLRETILHPTQASMVDSFLPPGRRSYKLDDRSLQD